MKKYLIGIVVRIAILYAIIYAIHYFSEVPISYLAFGIGCVVAFISFSGDGLSNFNQKQSTIIYGDAKVSPVEKVITSIKPMFVASLLVFLSSFVIMMITL
ncbi:hypothetical protein E3U55_15320 [Filobacillus milosensis]|uniref:Uncharacterized protein n=1 Tax=Filobacillus milosensis TaxID=94137 RepID=A0A4Y8IG46_9BACI|nr:hypothetical protein [Filobacillus milosensis]TFB13773.1 hypothetical protein E3U55_15320 [Filobacillus milosensis]